MVRGRESGRLAWNALAAIEFCNFSALSNQEGTVPDFTQKTELGKGEIANGKKDGTEGDQSAHQGSAIDSAFPRIVRWERIVCAMRKLQSDSHYLTR